MTIAKPTTVTEIYPPFKKIGEAGWEGRLRSLLKTYGVPMPTPVAIHELLAKEEVLGFRLPDSVRKFLLAFGALDFGSLRVLSLDEVGPLTDMWFASGLCDMDQARLSSLIATIDYLGTGGYIAWDKNSGGFHLVGHDPRRVRAWLPTFDDCVREQCVHLAVGRYGWPGDDVAHLVYKAKQDLFPSLAAAGLA